MRSRVRAELSLPTGVTTDGDVLGWRERIILPDIVFSADPALRDRDEETEEKDDVQVTRKR